MTARTGDRTTKAPTPQDMPSSLPYKPFRERLTWLHGVVQSIWGLGWELDDQAEPFLALWECISFFVSCEQ